MVTGPRPWRHCQTADIQPAVARAATTSPSVDAGYYLLLTPLGLGEQVIHFGGNFPTSLGGSIDTPYIVNSVPEPSSVALLGAGIIGFLACGRRRLMTLGSSPPPS